MYVCICVHVYFVLIWRISFFSPLCVCVLGGGGGGSLFCFSVCFNNHNSVWNFTGTPVIKSKQPHKSSKKRTKHKVNIKVHNPKTRPSQCCQVPVPQRTCTHHLTGPKANSINEISHWTKGAFTPGAQPSQTSGCPTIAC